MGQFRQPGGVVVDQTDRIYVADTYNHRIQVFAPDGRFLQAFARRSSAWGIVAPKRHWPGGRITCCMSRIQAIIAFRCLISPVTL